MEDSESSRPRAKSSSRRQSLKDRSRSRESDDDDTSSVKSGGSERRRRRSRSNSMESVNSRASSSDGETRRRRSKSKSSRRSSASLRDSEAPIIQANIDGKRDIRQPKKGRGIFDDDNNNDDENEGGRGEKRKGRGRRGGSPGRRGADDEERRAMLQARLRSKTVVAGDFSAGARFRWSKPKVVTERERAKIVRHRNQIFDRQRRMGMKETEIEGWASKVLASGFRAMIRNQRAKRASIHQQQMDLAHLKDFWTILTSVKGLPVNKQKRVGGKPVKRFMWVDEDMWRLMCGNVRSLSRKDVTGLFLLDISAVWRGCRTQAFKRLIDVKGYERDPACCMSLVGSERTIDLVFSTSSEREAMFQLFSLLVKSVHQKAKEKNLAQYQMLNKVKKRNKFSEFMSALNLVRVLQGPKGLRVSLVMEGAKKEPRNLRMVQGGRIIPAHLSYDELEEYNEKAKLAHKHKMKMPSKRDRRNTYEVIHREAGQERSTWSKRKNSNFWGRLTGNAEFVDYSATKGTEEGMFMVDVVDCRPGMFSPVFADLIGVMKANIKFFGVDRKELDMLDLVTVTLIGAERTFSLEFPTQRERDNFVSGMSALIARCSGGDEVLVEAMLLRPLKTVTEKANLNSLTEMETFDRESRDSQGYSQGGNGGMKGKFFGSSFRETKTDNKKQSPSYDMLGAPDGDLGGIAPVETATANADNLKTTTPKNGLDQRTADLGGMNGGNHEAIL